jgi:superfamily II DNA helicase RecQ
LKQWRLERARADDVPAYVVFHNSTLAEIAGRKPQSLRDLATVPGVGPAKLERYGDDVLSALVRLDQPGG